MAAWLPAVEDPDIPTKVVTLSSLILKTGGVTFLMYLLIGMLGSIAQIVNLNFPNLTIVKMVCIFTNMAWYWNSVNSEIREETDKIIMYVYSTLFGKFQWLLNW